MNGNTILQSKALKKSSKLTKKKLPDRTPGKKSPKLYKQQPKNTDFEELVITNSPMRVREASESPSRWHIRGRKFKAILSAQKQKLLHNRKKSVEVPQSVFSLYTEISHCNKSSLDPNLLPYFALTPKRKLLFSRQNQRPSSSYVNTIKFNYHRKINSMGSGFGKKTKEISALKNKQSSESIVVYEKNPRTMSQGLQVSEDVLNSIFDAS